MVFKPFTTLARQSISKHLVNGYAQSVVAATQSSYASSTVQLSRLSGSSGQSNAPTRLNTAFRTSDVLNTYHEDKDKDSKKYLFSKKILWSKAQHQQKQLLEIEADPVKSRSGSLVTADAVPPLLEVPEEGAFVEEVFEEEVVTAAAEAQEALQPEKAAEPAAPVVEEDEEVFVPPASPVVSPETTLYNQQLQSLLSQGKHHELIALFQLMIKEGVQPSTATYNLLLTAVVETNTVGVTQVINVYKDMLARGILPSTVTYSILIDFLAANAKTSLHFTKGIMADQARFGFVVPSRMVELKEIQSQAPMDLALDIFYASTEVRKERVFPESTYAMLADACAEHVREEDMLKVYTHMEQRNVLPSVDIMLSLIKGFGKTGNMSAAIETYNQYRTSELAQRPGAVDERFRVYKTLIVAYMDADDAAGALSFLEKIMDASTDQVRSEKLADAVIQGFLERKNIEAAREWILSRNMRASDFMSLSRTLIAVSDLGDIDLASKLYVEFNAHIRSLGISHPATAIAQMAFLALCVKTGRVESARGVWGDLADRALSSGPDVEAATLYTVMLFENGLTNEALVVLKQFIDLYLERPYGAPLMLRRNYLQQTCEHLVLSISRTGFLTPSIALDLCGFNMVHCGQLGLEASRTVMKLFGAERILGLTMPQLDLLLRVQSGVLVEVKTKGFEQLPEDVKRFEQMLSVAMKANIPLNPALKDSIDQAVMALGDPTEKWNAFVQAQTVWESLPHSPVHSSEMSGSPTLVASEGETIPEDNFDPYWAKTDVKVSQAIDNALEGARTTRPRLSDAKRMYQQTRRAGRLVRMTTLARMVAAAASSNQPDFMYEIYRNAKNDTPLLMEYRSVRYVWCVLLDAMVAGHLTLGNRQQASVYHEEMLKMGASPSANTYGLYIVSLKGSDQTYDEASEALKIFERAKSENVVPSSFLYNVLIGKLAKARRVDDCLFYFAEMRALGIKPTSVTYGTMINALTRVGDEHFAEELFQEMEAMPNYKPRPAPYNSLIQFFVNTKRDRTKAMAYFNRMMSLGIEPTGHTYKLLIEAYATLDPPDMLAAEGILEMIRANGQTVETSHHAALIHAKGCILHDLDSAIAHFTAITESGSVAPDNTIYQALLESLVANHRVKDTPAWITDMKRRGIRMTPYIANTLIHGWATEKDIVRAKAVYDSLSNNENDRLKREPSTYEAMTRAYLAVEDREGAMMVVEEMGGRGYPHAVTVKVAELVRGREASAVAAV
ncbi:uncharacterized protein LAJ45_00431 [Morchella importuna]|uniref:uncharacterized protein n=1 Tax=Morchella importuna TaxID=1174673 RepID=UPI001E8DD91D|nr:uncharacterized protein LAJ45_00431 [Morchella importuna]KAH8155421.1 hypothetical protein LAJ45_00431 [Morchella importuna]